MLGHLRTRVALRWCRKGSRAAAVASTVVVGFVAVVLPAASGASAARAGGDRVSSAAFFGDPAPGGGQFTFDFEPSAINERADVAFTADVTTGGEGVFVARHGR